MIIAKAGPAKDPVFADDDPLVSQLTDRLTAAEKNTSNSANVKGNKRRSDGALVTLSVAALALSVVLLLAAAYSWNVVRQVQALSAELDDLRQFETRIINRLDQYNNGMQAMMEATNNRLSVLQGQIDDAVTRPQSQTTPSRSGAPRVQSPPYSRSFFIPEENKFRPYDPASASLEEQRGFPGQLPPSDGEGSITSVLGGNIQFRRVTAPDGSVKYERIR